VTDYRRQIDDAWDCLDRDEPGHAVVLARAILDHRPEVIDAYVVLSAATEVRAEAIALLKEAVCVGAAFRKGEVAEDIPYDLDAHTRALGNLARLLWEAARPGNRAEALRHARLALRLDPNDRAGTRLLLMGWEASAGNWPAARRIVRRYSDERRTELRYWLALHAFRDGDADADALLDTAIDTNPHVFAALSGRLVALRLPDTSYSFGSPDEAALYAANAQDGWTATPGALKWLTSRQPLARVTLR
jgi:tetratricopeptide (TPR) repeat protein